MAKQQKGWFKAKHPSTIPDEFYKPIGQIMVGYLYTDLYMQSIAWHALRIRNVKAARLLTTGRNAVDQEKLFLSLTPRWISDPSQVAEVQAIHAEAEKIRAFRNKLAHGYWGYEPGTKPRRWLLFYLRENDAKIDPKDIQITEALLLDWVRRVNDLNARITAFHKQRRAPIP